jgi:hypothetical protein
VRNNDLASRLAALVATSTADDHSLAVISDVLRERDKFHLVLQDLSLDQATFYGRYGCTQQSFLNKAEALLAEQPPGTRDALISVLLLFGRSIEMSSRFAGGGPEPGPAELDYLQQIIRAADGFSETLHRVYDFAPLDAPLRARSESEVHLDWATMDLHRLGTTSLIFSIRTTGFDSRKLALKLNHVLFTTVGPIASATSSYFSEWGDLSRACPFTARVIGSGVGWILEEFIEGPTLREFVRAHSQQVEPLLLTMKVFPPILEALQSFHRANNGQGHGDINPANIIIQRRSAARSEINARDSQYEYVAYLIDMGRNLLASDTIGRVRSADASFVAPEVRQMPPDQRVVDCSADFFSLGHILAFCLGYEESDGFYFLDERLFRDQPLLARLAAGLINNGASARLRYVRGLAPRNGAAAEQQRDDIQVLLTYSVALMEMLKEITDQSLLSAHGGWRVLGEGAFGTWKAVGIALRQLVRTWQRRDLLSLFEVATSARIVASAFVYLLGIAILIYVTLLEVHRDPLDLGLIFRNLGFRREDRSFNFQLIMICATFYVAAFQYNVVCFGGISFLRTCANPVLRVISEIWLWVVAAIVLICMTIALFINPELWILVSAGGQTVVIVNNVLSMAARRTIARRLEASSDHLGWYKASAIVRQAKYDILSYWTPTYVAYCSFLYALAILAALNVLHDFLVYAVAISVLNLFVLSYSQATRQGPILRGNLSQFAVAGENLRFAVAPEPLFASTRQHESATVEL